MPYTFCSQCGAHVEWGPKCSQCGATISLYHEDSDGNKVVEPPEPVVEPKSIESPNSIKLPEYHPNAKAREVTWTFSGWTFRQAINIVKSNSRQLYFVVIAFVLLGILGYYEADSFKDILQQLSYEWAPVNEESTIVAIVHIIFINLRGSGLFVLLGVIFFPLLGLISNAMIIGAACYFGIEAEGFSMLWLLIPHGIFELPAMCLSITMGLRIGLCWFKGNRIDNFKRTYKEAFQVFIFIVLPLLIVAGILEVTIVRNMLV